MRHPLSRGHVDWKVAAQTLSKIHKISPQFFNKNVLIGGSACWFYREALASANDPDFKLPQSTPSDEINWLSKDMDFIGTTVPEMAALLGVTLSEEKQKILINNVWIDSPVVGIVINAENGRKGTRSAYIDEIQVEVVNPALLYAEKVSLVKGAKESNTRPQDALHVTMMEQYLSYELCYRVEASSLPELDAKDWRSDAILIKSVHPEFFETPALAKRLLSAMTRLISKKEASPVYHWIKHHVTQRPQKILWNKIEPTSPKTSKGFKI